MQNKEIIIKRVNNKFMINRGEMSQKNIILKSGSWYFRQIFFANT